MMKMILIMNQIQKMRKSKIKNKKMQYQQKKNNKKKKIKKWDLKLAKNNKIIKMRN